MLSAACIRAVAKDAALSAAYSRRKVRIARSEFGVTRHPVDFVREYRRVGRASRPSPWKP